MKGLQESAVGDFTRGGQTVLMFVRMIGEVLRKFAGLALLLYSATTLALFFHRTESYERYLLVKYAAAVAATEWLNNGPKPTSIRNPDGSYVTVRFVDVYNAPVMRQNLHDLIRVWLGCMLVSITVALTILAMLMVTIWRFGRSQRKEQLLRGSQIVEANQVRSDLHMHGVASDMSLGGVPIIKDSEVQHILLTGSPGTGKSSLLYGLFKRIRERGDRCICYSPSGDFIQWFHRAKTDVLLNPFDNRCPSWDPWQECVQDYHYDMLASALVPDGKSPDPFWDKASRVVISQLLQRCRENDERRIGRFLQLLSEVDLDDLHAYVSGTPAYTLLNPATEKTAQGIRTTATTYAHSLRYLPRKPDPFNIREWVLDDSSDQWIFLNAHADQRDAARPLLSAWLEVFTSAILSLPEDRQRRIWLVIDELPSLHKLASLPAFLAESRKFGGCGVIAFQMISQLREIYGPDGADSLSGLCATWACLRQNDPKTAEWTAKSFGEAEILEQSEGLSYGSHEMRDGVSLSQNRKMRQILLPAEVRNLDDLEGYIRLRGKLKSGPVPVAHFQMKRPKIKSVSEAFIKAKRIEALPAPQVIQPAQGSAGAPAEAEIEPDPLLTEDIFHGGAEPPRQAVNQ